MTWITLEENARALAGLKGYFTNLRARPLGAPLTPEFVHASRAQAERDSRSVSHPRAINRHVCKAVNAMADDDDRELLDAGWLRTEGVSKDARRGPIDAAARQPRSH